MPITDPQDTLAYHLSRPLTTARDMSTVSVKDVVTALTVFKTNDKSSNTVPETEALTFYGLNHGMALLGQHYAPLEPLPEKELKFVRLYYSTLNEKAMRAFYYLLIICTREARHCKSWSSDKGKCKAKFGEATANFLTSGSGEQGIHNNLVNMPPQTTIGNYVKAIQWAFYNCGWPGGFGGPAWGKVTDCLVNFVTGDFTAELMLDTIWTLCHNNGPIFNKGHLYSMHNTSVLTRILDIQRSGQIPQAFCTPVGCETIDGYLPNASSTEIPAAIAWVRERFDLLNYVDWYTVEALGSVKKYPHEKTQQNVKYGLSPVASEMEKKAAEAEKQAAALAVMKKAEYDKNHWEVYPGFTVKKIHRAA